MLILGNVGQATLLILFVAAIYLALPAAIVMGWLHWAKHTSRLNIPSALSLVGFALATASGVLAVLSVVYASAIHGFAFYDPSLLRIFRTGGLLSLAGLIFGLGGVWRSSPLRWYAPACAFGTLLFWFAMATGE